MEFFFSAIFSIQSFSNELFRASFVALDVLLYSSFFSHLSSIPVRTDINDVIHYFKLSDTNYKNFDLVSIMKITYMLMDISQEKNPPDGLIVLIDAKGVSINDFIYVYIKFL